MKLDAGVHGMLKVTAVLWALIVLNKKVPGTRQQSLIA